MWATVILIGAGFLAVIIIVARIYADVINNAINPFDE